MQCDSTIGLYECSTNCFMWLFVNHQNKWLDHTCKLLKYTLEAKQSVWFLFRSMLLLQYKLTISNHCLYCIFYIENFYIENAKYQPRFTYTILTLWHLHIPLWQTSISRAYWAQTLYFYMPIITECYLSSILIPSFVSIHACKLVNLSCYLFSCT